VRNEYDYSVGQATGAMSEDNSDVFRGDGVLLVQWFKQAEIPALFRDGALHIPDDGL
jgi:hypothetical protein